MDIINLLNIDKAYSIIKRNITKTPLITNEAINNLVGAKVYFKLENLQHTSSFKIRGAMYKISLLSNKQKEKGVVAYSSGNHAQAVAFASLKEGIKSTIVMPITAPKIKIQNTIKYGSKIVFYNPKREEREPIGKKIA